MRFKNKNLNESKMNYIMNCKYDSDELLDLESQLDYINMNSNNINDKDSEGNTILHIYFSKLKNIKNIDIKKLNYFLELGCNPMIKNNNNYIPLQCYRNYDELYNFFFKNIKKKNKDIVNLMLKLKINIFSYSEYDRLSCIDLASKYKESIVLLKEFMSNEFKNDELKEKYLCTHSEIFHCPQLTKKNYILGKKNGQRMLFEDNGKVKVGIWNNYRWNIVKI